MENFMFYRGKKREMSKSDFQEMYKNNISKLKINF